MAKKKPCFVIGPIGEPDSTIRKCADKVFKHIIVPAVEAFDYDTPVRADQIPRPGAITTEVLQHILNDDLVIADLTGPNANAYYELAVSHARRKSFIHLIRKGEQIPFDTKDLRTIPIGTEVDEAEEARENIKKYISEVEDAGDEILTPISQIIEWELMKASGDTQQKSMADILASIQDQSSISAEHTKALMAIWGRVDEIAKRTYRQHTHSPIIEAIEEAERKYKPGSRRAMLIEKPSTDLG